MRDPLKGLAEQAGGQGGKEDLMSAMTTNLRTGLGCR